MTINGTTVQWDMSGCGHCWVDATDDNCPANIAQEIECETIDGGQDSCSDYVASNGQHYRW